MIEFKNGDLFSIGTEALVNAVNCVGVMGKGIALQFKIIYPENFEAYRAACINREVRPGKMFVFDTGLDPRYIINFPTKRHWRDNSLEEDIDSGLAALKTEIKNRNIKSIAIPPLGCGLGGLAWDTVRPKIENILGNLEDTKIIVLEPQ